MTDYPLYDFLDPKQLDLSDERFQFHFPAGPAERLLTAVKADGIIQPIDIVRRAGKWVIVHGFRRMQAAMKWEPKIIPVRILPPDTDDGTLLRQSVIASWCEADLTLVEKAQILRRAIAAGEANAEWKELLTLPRGRKYDEVLRDIPALSDDWKHFLTDKSVPLKRIRHFARLKNWDILTPFLKMTMSLNHLENLAVMMGEIAQRDRLDSRDIFQHCGIADDIKRWEDAPDPAIPVRIRDRITACRYPHRTAWEKKLKHQINALDLPSGVQVTLDPTLEWEGITIKARLDSPESLDALIQRLADQKNRLNQLIHPDFHEQD